MWHTAFNEFGTPGLHRGSNCDLLMLSDLKAASGLAFSWTTLHYNNKNLSNERNTVAEIRNLNLNVGYPLTYYASLANMAIPASKINTQKSNKRANVGHNTSRN